jgi:FtsP/CotA-like multicopper oxidase with cupredoxin domain
LRGEGLRGNSGGEPDRRLITFKLEGGPLSERGPILSQQNPALPPVIKLQAAKRLDLTIEKSQSPDPRQTWTLNGVASHGADVPPLFKVRSGQPVTLGFINRSRIAQTVHVHGHALRVLHLLDDGWEPYWRDSVIVPPGGTVRVAFIADNPGKWLIESTILDHAMSGLAAWLEVGL